MGSGLTGGPLTGGPVNAALPPAPAGQSAVLSGPLGASAGDVVTKIGSTVADGSVSGAAKLTSFRTGVGATEVEKSFVLKNGSYVAPTGAPLWLNGADATGCFIMGTSTAICEIGVSNGVVFAFQSLTAGTLEARISAAASYGFVASSRNGTGATDVCMKVGTQAADASVNAAAKLLSVRVGLAGGTEVEKAAFGKEGRLDLYGSDSTGTPGAATIDKPSGKSSIAAGASTVTITCNQCTAASRLHLTFHARDATGLLPIGVPGAGSFTVTTTANCTAALPFSWEVSNII